MSKLKDEYVSAEHYLLALAGENNSAAKALKELGATRDKIMQGLQQVRGSQRVTDQKIRKGNIRRWKNMGAISHSWRGAAKSIPSSGVTTRFAVSCRCFAADEKQSGTDRRACVGKTAIVILHIVSGDVPESLKNKRIIAMDIARWWRDRNFAANSKDRLKAF